MDPRDIRQYIAIFYWLFNSSLNNLELINQLMSRSFAFFILQYMQLMDVTITTLYAETMYLSVLRNPRTIWMLQRSEAVWLEMWEIWNDQQWITTFRMTKAVFLTICNPIRHKLLPLPNVLCSRVSISPEKQLAITLYYLASCCEYRVAGNVFGVHKTSVWRCVHRVIDAINDVLLPQWIKMPDDTECTAIAAAFEAKCNIPQIIGAIDGTYIPIKPPTDGYRDFINRKGWSSMVLQAVVDNKFMFRNINIQAPGSCHDAAVHRESTLFKYHDRIIPQTTKEIIIPQDNQDDRRFNIPYFIIGDPAYPLLSWLIKGYTRSRVLTQEEILFNVSLNRARVNVEIAFGRLKARWRVVSKQMDVHYKFVPDVVAACCVLHNILELNGLAVSPFLIARAEDDARQHPQPDGLLNRNRDDLTAANMRDFLSSI